jgi:hypothetical protein
VSVYLSVCGWVRGLVSVGVCVCVICHSDLLVEVVLLDTEVDMLQDPVAAVVLLQQVLEMFCMSLITVVVHLHWKVYGVVILRVDKSAMN